MPPRCSRKADELLELQPEIEYVDVLAAKLPPGRDEGDRSAWIGGSRRFPAPLVRVQRVEKGACDEALT